MFANGKLPLAAEKHLKRGISGADDDEPLR